MSDLPDRSRLLALAALPDEVKGLRQWIVWRYEPRPGKDKPAKVPYQPRTGRRARTDTPATWGTWQQALARYRAGGWDGLGFVFTAADPYCGIDLDGCRDPDTGEIASWAEQIVDALESYTEVSPSGRSLHILLQAVLPEHFGRKQGAVEVYDAERYFAVTGERLVGTPATLEERQGETLALYATLAREEPESLPAAARPRPTLAHSDAEVVAKALTAANGATFQALWSGDLSAYRDSCTGQVDQSRADFALCLLLAYWCESDPDQMDRLFRQSALFRPKWDAQFSGHGRTYGQVTIWNAIRRHERLAVTTPARSRR